MRKTTYQRRHVAIVRSPVAEQLLNGRKRVESRLYRSRRPPYGSIAGGDDVIFKHAGGDVFGMSRVTSVRQFDALTPARVRGLRREFNGLICGSEDYWTLKRGAKYGVLLWLSRLRPVTFELEIPRQFGNGWLLLAPAPA